MEHKRDAALGRKLVALPASRHALLGEWHFEVDADGVGAKKGWADPAFDDSSWVPVQIPHTWNAMSEWADYQGLAWYRRAFVVPPSWQDALVRLRFEGVFYLARVWLNGQYLGEHEGGYAAFEFDVSACISFDAPNVLVVQVDNVGRPDRIPCIPLGWYNWGGILRDVSLEVTSRAYMRNQRIVSTPHLVDVDQADEAAITATVWVRNASSDMLEGTLVASVLDDATDEPILSECMRSALRLAPGEEIEVTSAVTLPSPRLWHFDHPYLYRWSASLLGSGGSTLHVNKVAFGVRLVELKQGRFCLNGEPMRLVGFTRHADSPEHGPAEPIEVMRADYEDMKQLNMVFARPVHYPQHPFILDYCDRNGILMIPEIPAWQLRTRQLADPHMRDLARQQLREMIESEWNHPAVWAWSVANEIDSNTPEGREFIQDMAAYVHELDPTRPVSNASDRLGRGAWRDACADFLLMNQYYGMWHGPKDLLGPVLDVVHAAWPDKVLFISEWGFAAAYKEWEAPPNYDPVRYYDIPQGLPPDAPEADVVRCQQIADQMPVFRSKPFVSGVVYWTYQDYRVPGAYYVMGVVDAQRRRRPSWQQIRSEYAPASITAVEILPCGNGRCQAMVHLQTRGPIEEDMPVYTLRGYRLRWCLTSPDGERTLAEGDVGLPVLPPATVWQGRVEWAAQNGPAMFRVELVRSTGFVVTEKQVSLGVS